MKREISNFEFRISKCLYISLFTFFLTACSKGPEESDDLPAPPPSKAEFVPPAKTAGTSRYAYRGDKNDPMVPLGGSAGALVSTKEIENIGPSRILGALDLPDIATLSLRGLIHDKNKKRLALVSGGGRTFVLRGGRLYDERGKPVQGVAGVVQEKGIVIFSDTERVTLRLSKEEGGTKP